MNANALIGYLRRFVVNKYESHEDDSWPCICVLAVNWQHAWEIANNVLGSRHAYHIEEVSA